MERCSAGDRGTSSVSFGPPAKDAAAACSSPNVRKALGGSVFRQPPKPALVSRSYRGLPGQFQEYLCGDQLVCLCI